MKMDEEWPDHFDEHGAAVAEPHGGRRPAKTSTPWPTWSRSSAVVARLFARSVGLGSSWIPSFGQWPTGSSTISTLPTAGYKTRLEDLLGPEASGSRSGASPTKRSKLVQGLDPRGDWRRAIYRECLLAAAKAGRCPTTTNLRTLITSATWKILEPQPPAGHRASGPGYSIDLIKEVCDARIAQVEPQAGRRSSAEAAGADRSRPMSSSNARSRRAEYEGPFGRRPHAGACSSVPYYRKMLQGKQCQRLKPESTFKRQAQLGPVVDRLDQSAARQYVDSSGPGHRGPSDRLHRPGPRSDRTAQDAADRRSKWVST